MLSISLSAAASAYGVFEPSPSLSGDARLLAYVSYAPGDRHGSIYVRDLVSGSVRNVTAALAGAEQYSPVLAANGTTLVFTSVPAGWAGAEQVLVANLVTGTFAQASTNAAGAAGNGDSRFASVSADGRYVAFESAASNLVAGDDNGADDVFVKDLHTGAVRRISEGPAPPRVR